MPAFLWHLICTNFPHWCDLGQIRIIFSANLMTKLYLQKILFWTDLLSNISTSAPNKSPILSAYLAFFCADLIQPLIGGVEIALLKYIIGRKIIKC